MKKTIIFISVFLLFGIIVAAITFNSRQEALDYKDNYISSRDNAISNLVTTITYVTDKECYIYPREYCEVCFTYDGDDDVSECMQVSENSTVVEIDDLIKKFVRKELEDSFMVEEIKYTKDILKDRVIISNTESKIEYYCVLEDNRTSDCYSVSGSRCYHNPEKQGYNSCRSGIIYADWILI